MKRDNIQITNLKDTMEINYKNGKQLVNLFKKRVTEKFTSIIDDFAKFDRREDCLRRSRDNDQNFVQNFNTQAQNYCNQPQKFNKPKFKSNQVQGVVNTGIQDQGKQGQASQKKYNKPAQFYGQKFEDNKEFFAKDEEDDQNQPVKERFFIKDKNQQQQQQKKKQKSDQKNKKEEGGYRYEKDENAKAILYESGSEQDEQAIQPNLNYENSQENKKSDEEKESEENES